MNEEVEMKEIWSDDGYDECKNEGVVLWLLSSGGVLSVWQIGNDEEEISSSFEENKTKLAWPVTTGFISSKFGKHPHPVMKGIIQDNPGVDIQTNKDETVKSVFGGKVIQIAYVPGMYNVVIVQHGEYYTVYSRLKEVMVKKGTLIPSNQPIGVVHTDKDGISEVHFEVWKNFAKLNPEGWLSPKWFFRWKVLCLSLIKVF